MYCTNCRSPLKHTAENNCPECGKTFDPDDRTTYLNTPTKNMHSLHAVIGIAIVGTTLFWAMASGGDIATFIDFPTILFLAGMIVGGMWLSFGPTRSVEPFILALNPKSKLAPHAEALNLLIFARAYQLTWAAGLLGFLCGLVIVLQNMDDPSKIGPGIAVAMLPFIYAGLLAEIIIAPIQHLFIHRFGLAKSATDTNLRGSSALIVVCVAAVLGCTLILYILVTLNL